MRRISGLLLSVLVLAAIVPMGTADTDLTADLIDLTRDVLDQARGLIGDVRVLADRVRDPGYVYDPEDLGAFTVPTGLDELLGGLGGLGALLRDLLAWALEVTVA